MVPASSARTFSYEYKGQWFKKVKEWDFSDIKDIELEKAEVPAEYYNLNGINQTGGKTL